VILSCLIRCDSLPAEQAMLKNSIPDRQSEFYTRIFSRVGWQIAGWNRFSRRKNSFNKDDTRLLPTPRNDRGIDALVTTRHMLSAGDARRASDSLPIPLPNFDCLRTKCDGKAEGGRGGSARRSRRKSRIGKLARKFYAKWNPLPHFAAQKKALGAHSRPSRSAILL
jgi:hypothetical protein